MRIGMREDWHKDKDEDDPTVSRTGLSRPSTASSVTTTVPGGRPMPPQVPILGRCQEGLAASRDLMKMGSFTPAWYISLITWTQGRDMGEET